MTGGRVLVADVSGAPKWGLEFKLWIGLVYLIGIQFIVYGLADMRLPSVAIAILIAALLAGVPWFLLKRRRRRAAGISFPDFGEGANLFQVREALADVYAARSGRHKHYMWAALNIVLAIAAPFAAVVAIALVTEPEGWVWFAAEGIGGVAALLFVGNALRMLSNRSSAAKFIVGKAVYWICRVLQWVALVQGFIVIVISSEYIRNDRDWTRFYIGVGILALFFVFRWIARVANAWTAPTVDHARRADQRPPILLLRSFRDDDGTVRWNDDEDNSYRRVEEVIEAQARQYGPLVAVGKPGEVRLTGAARAFFEGDDWQVAVRRWLDEARFCVLIAGLTPGVRWELTTTFDLGHAEKLVIVFPPNDAHHYERVEWLRRCLGRTAWREAVRQANFDTALAVVVVAGGDLMVAQASEGTGAEFDSALAVAFLMMLGQRTFVGLSDEDRAKFGGKFLD